MDKVEKQNHDGIEEVCKVDVTSIERDNLINKMKMVVLKVGKILSVEKHPFADRLYIEEVDMGEEKPRTVISGLVEHLEMEDLLGKLCVFVYNMKPNRMKGIVSESMILVAKDQQTNLLELLKPPNGAIPGDIVIVVEEFPCGEKAILNPKKKIFEDVKKHFSINNNGEIIFLNEFTFMIKDKGAVCVKSIRDGEIG